MEALFEFVFELLAEIFVQIFAEFIGVAVHAAIDKLRRGNRVAIVVAMTLAGLAAGGLSLLVWPQAFVRDPALRYVNLLISPAIAAGLATGLARLRGGERAAHLAQTFLSSWLFAIAFALVRLGAATR